MGGARGARAAPRPERGRRGGGRRVGPPRNLTPLLRLVGLIALAILVVVVVAVWVDGLRERGEARPQQHVSLRDRRDRERLGSAGPAAERHAHDAWAEPGRPRREARRLRADGREPGAARGGSEPARGDGGAEHGRGRVAPVTARTACAGCRTPSARPSTRRRRASPASSSSRRRSGCSRATSSGRTPSRRPPRRCCRTRRSRGSTSPPPSS